MDVDTLVARVQARMKQLGLTAKGLSLAAGLSATYIRDLTKGRSRNPKAEQLQKLATALNMGMEELLGQSASPGFAAPPQAPALLEPRAAAADDDNFAQLADAVERMLREEGMPHGARNVALLSRKLWPRILALPAAMPFQDRLEMTISERRSIVQRARRAIFDEEA